MLIIQMLIVFTVEVEVFELMCVGFQFFFFFLFPDQ